MACTPVLLVLAWNGAAGAFLALCALGLVSDVLDGVLARRLGQESDFGARLDQWAELFKDVVDIFDKRCAVTNQRMTAARGAAVHGPG